MHAHTHHTPRFEFAIPCFLVGSSDVEAAGWEADDAVPDISIDADDATLSILNPSLNRYTCTLKQTHAEMLLTSW